LIAKRIFRRIIAILFKVFSGAFLHKWNWLGDKIANHKNIPGIVALKNRSNPAYQNNFFNPVFNFVVH
jgi:hypothetical protein